MFMYSLVSAADSSILKLILISYAYGMLLRVRGICYCLLPTATVEVEEIDVDTTALLLDVRSCEMLVLLSN